MAADPEFLRDLFAEFGEIRLKRMFSGHGVYSGESCIALAINPGLCFRVDDANRAAFKAVGAARFTYDKKSGAVTVQAWWKMPETMLDEPDEIARFARLSLEAARRRPPSKKSKAKSEAAGVSHVPVGSKHAAPGRKRPIRLRKPSADE
jgi:DNA transformation protein